MLAWLASFVLASTAPAQVEPAELWIEGNAAFRSGRFDVAIDRYRALLGAGVDDGELHYNLGNAYLRSGALGEAIAAYRAAQARLPRNEDVEANLRFARGRAKDALAPPAPSPALRALFFWHYSLSRDELTALVVAANALLWLALGLAVSRRRAAYRGAALVLALAVAALAPSWALRAFARETVAVVRTAEAAVHAGVGQDTVVRFRLHEGAEAIVTGEDEGWVRVRLSDDKQGWLPLASVALVAP